MSSELRIMIFRSCFLLSAAIFFATTHEALMKSPVGKKGFPLQSGLGVCSSIHELLPIGYWLLPNFLTTKYCKSLKKSIFGVTNEPVVIPIAKSNKNY